MMLHQRFYRNIRRAAETVVLVMVVIGLIFASRGLLM
jgi:hypothetical protein